MLIATTLWLLHTIYNLLILPFMQCAVQSGYSKHACSLIDQRLLPTVRRQSGNMRQVCTMTSCTNSYQLYALLLELLLVDMDCNCMRTGFKVCMSLYSIITSCRKENLFHKLIYVIQNFTRKIFMVQYYPQNFNIEFFQTTVVLIFSIYTCLYNTAIRNFIKIKDNIKCHSIKSYTSLPCLLLHIYIYILMRYLPLG